MDHKRQQEALSIIQAGFSSRVKKNPRYSLRAYSKLLGVYALFAQIMLESNEMCSYVSILVLGNDMCGSGSCSGSGSA